MELINERREQIYEYFIFFEALYSRIAQLQGVPYAESANSTKEDAGVVNNTAGGTSIANKQKKSKEMW